MTTDDRASVTSDDRTRTDEGSTAVGSTDAADATDDEPTADDRNDGSAHVLLLEDDDSLRRLLTQKLESSGYETTALSDGRECWAFLNDEEPPDLVLLDVMVPGLDGFRLLGRIRNDDRLADVPVIVLTARGREEDIVKGFDLGADDYVTKPFSPAALVARVRRLLS